MANVTFLNQEGEIKVRIDDTKCIACGSCIPVCKHNARYYLDDTEQFFSDLKQGIPITVIAAPSLRVNFPNWKNILFWLKTLGASRIYDVSLGAEICIWAHVRYLEQNPSRAIITQPCPAIVSFCEIYHPELLPNLSPIHSPMSCLAIYMKEYEPGHTGGKIAALTPCIAKTNEFEATGLIDYNITFAKLKEYYNSDQEDTPIGEIGFDHKEGGGLGSLFPSPGGLKENIEFFLGKNIGIVQVEGFGIYNRLDDYSAAGEKDWPRVFDLLNCKYGCNIGTGCARDQDFFTLQKALNAYRREKLTKYDHTYYEQLYAKFDRTFEPDSFRRVYKSAATPVSDISEENIGLAFRLLGKESYTQQNFNCGACGSRTCRDMARKIALKINIPMNCIVKSRDDTRLARDRSIEYIKLIQNIGEYMFATDQDNFNENIENALMAICLAVGGNAIRIWKNSYDALERPVSRRLFSFPAMDVRGGSLITDEILPGWLDALADGQNLMKVKTEMSELEKIVYAGRNIDTVFSVPLLIHGDFWGFISVFRQGETPFTQEEISVITASGIMLVSSITGLGL
jgi:ferredoxin